MYNFPSIATICCVLCVSCSLAAPSTNNLNFKTGEYKPEQFSKASPNNEAVHVLPLTQRSVGTATSAGYVQSLRKGTQVNGVYGNSKVTSVESGLVFVTEIEVGGETFTAVVDTGSSDTWLVETGFTCAKGDQSFCQFGDTYNKTNTFQPIANENFAISYSDGELLTGSFGKEKVTVAGITVKDQQIAVVTRANWNGDGYSSGVLGLGFPANTKAYSGINPGANSQKSRVDYNPFFTSAYTEGNVPPLFSLALSRNPNGGMLAIGGLPPVPYVPIFASTPFQMLTASSPGSTGKPDYTFYTITVNGFEYQSAQSNWNLASWLTYFGNPNDLSTAQVIIDSGTTVNYLPQTIADQVNELFIPPAEYNPQLGYYVVDCNAKAPEFGIKIGPEIFYVNPLDNILRLSPTKCITGISATGPGGISILGHTFLKNVVAVFDVGASQMRFAAREYS